MPRQNAKNDKQRCKNDLKNQCAFSFFYAEIINDIGTAACQIGHHSCVAAQQQIMDTAQKLVGNLAHEDLLVFFLLHSDHNEDRTHKAKNLCYDFKCCCIRQENPFLLKYTPYIS